MTGTLYMLCGKMAAGKSTLAARLATQNSGLLISEDDLLARLYPNTIVDLPSYVSCSGRLKNALEPLLVQLLSSGQSVVLDFPANNQKQRQWLKSLLMQSGAHHELHYLDLPDAVCKKRLRNRIIEQPERAATDTDEMYDALRPYFEPPGESEGFNLVNHVD